jgi:hypothetical protein
VGESGARGHTELPEHLAQVWTEHAQRVLVRLGGLGRRGQQDARAREQTESEGATPARTDNASPWSSSPGPTFARAACSARSGPRPPHPSCSARRCRLSRRPGCRQARRTFL